MKIKITLDLEYFKTKKYIFKTINNIKFEKSYFLLFKKRFIENFF